MPFRTLLDLLEDRAASSPLRTAFVFPGASGAPDARVAYQELRDRAVRDAAALQARLAPGDRVLLLLSAPADFVRGFYGCIAAGVLPVPVPTPRHAGDAQRLERLARVARETAAGAVLVDAGARALLDGAPFPGELPPLLGIDDLERGAAKEWRRPSPDPDAPAYLQFTSGSTLAPRGVMVTHANARAGAELIRRAFGHDERTVGFSWLPLYHDMGLMGHVVHLPAIGATSVIVPPEWFLRDPLRWPAALSRYRATTSGAPPFAYDLCVRRLGRQRELDVDLSAWSVAYAGAEAVPPATLEAFTAAFGPYGFRRSSWLPCYGLAEGTLLVAGTRSGSGWTERPVDAEALARGEVRGANAQGRTRALVGQALLGGEAEIRILDPQTGTPAAPGRVGEICVAGPIVTAGYWNQPDAEAFAGDGDGGRLLRTGDLGFVDDGHLYVSGRARDMLIVRGENHYPEDLERTARDSHPALAHHAAAAFSIPGADGEAPVIVHEVRRGTEAETLAQALEAVRAAVSRLHDLRVAAVALVPPGGLPRTTSGKVSRSSARDELLGGSLEVLAEWRDAPAAAPARRPEGGEIAIVGMACRFPGGADDPDALWRLLVEGRDAIATVPEDRWDADRFYDPRAAVPGKMNTRWGGWVDGVDLFDASFFGVATHEAVEMDPQQRLLLEVAWRAFESAGFPPERLAGSDTGVFVGISNNDYLHLKIRARTGLDHLNAYTGLGNANSVAANRISYHFDLRGPSFAVDTACSSSLTALHLAAESLRGGEASVALAGGVNLVLAPGATVTLSQFDMMAPDGRCKVFDASADGYVRSEGCGLVVLKRLEDAQRDGDRVLAVLRGSALGQDGRSHGITAPNGAAQRAVIERALRRAAADPAEVTLVEAHGTGTALGDPVEVEQIREVYGTAGARFCHLGSVKASLGHLESAAGIASVLKVVLALRHGQVPPQLHVQNLNPRIPLDGSRLRIPAAAEPWTAGNGPRLAAVSSFGFGGALAHALIQEAPAVPARAAAPARNPFHLFVLSARSPDALREQAQSWTGWLEQGGEATVGELAWTRATRRGHLPHRASFVASSRPGLQMALRAWADAAPPVRRAGSPPRVAFLFTGQGAQYAEMGRALYDTLPAFREAFDRCAAVVDGDGAGPPLREVAFGRDGAGVLNDTLYTQPVLFALEYAMTRLWAGLGVEPHAVLGHSVGEYAAACVAGCCTPEEGMALVWARARLMHTLAPGAMAAAFAAEPVVREVLAEHAPGLSVAAVNAPENVVVSGTVKEVEAAVAALEARDIRCVRVRTAYAFHSALVDPVLDAFEAEAARVQWRAPTMPWISNLTGRRMEDAPDARYWRRHLREAVRFRDGVEALAALGTDAWLEVGPGSTLASLARATLPAADAPFLRSLDREYYDRETVLRALGQLYQRGQEVRWEALFGAEDRRFVPDTPGHPFHRRRYWIDIDHAEAVPDAYPERAAARVAVPALAPRPDPADDAAPWIFDLRWAERPPAGDAEGRALAQETHWLLVGDGGALGTALARRLAAARRPVYRVIADPRQTVFVRKPVRENGVLRFSVPPGCARDTWFEAINYVLTHAGRVDASSWRIVYLGGLDAAGNDALSAAALERDQELHGPGELCALAQGIILTARVIPLTVVTRGAQAVVRQGQAEGAESPALSQAPLWGFGRTLFLEHPEMRGGLVDLDPAADGESDAARVIAQAGAPDGEAQVAFRGGARLVAQLVQADEVPARPVALRADGVYLVTGGLGGLGLRTARWLAERGARRLVLAGRTVPPERGEWDALDPAAPAARQVRGIREIEALGAAVDVVAADVGDPGQLARVMERARSSGAPLRGVVHAAGVNWFSRVRALDRGALLDALKVKVTAAWCLHEHTRHDDLDLFLLFSSVSALWGSVDLSHYTASNHFLDALAHHRRAAGLPALSLAWGPWAEVGMSAREHEVQVLTRLGFRLLEPDRAVDAMERLAASPRAQAVPADVDWGAFRTFIDFSGAPSLFARVLPGAEGTPAEAPVRAVEHVRAAPPAQAREALLALVKQQLSAVMLLDPAQLLDVTQRFNFMGMDSLMAIAFAARLETLLELKLPTTLAYNFPTIQAVTDHLYELIRGEAPGAEAAEGAADGDDAEDAERWFAVVRADPAPERRLFCFPYAGGGAAAYAQWHAAAEPGTEVVAILLPGREARADEAPVAEMETLAARLADAIESRAELPFAFYGHSLGALVAFAVARELRRRGAAGPRALVVSGCGVPRPGEAGRLHAEPDDAFVAGVEARFGGEAAVLRDPAMRAALLPALRADIALLETYEPAPEPPLDVPVLALGGTDDPLAPPERVSEWRAQTAAAFEQRLFAGDHMFPWSGGPGVANQVHREVRRWTAAADAALEPA